MPDHSCPTCGSDAITFDPGPALWSHEEDTYTQLGEGVVENVRDAVRKIVAPLMAAGADALHVGALTIEGVNQALFSEWNRRQDQP